MRLTKVEIEIIKQEIYKVLNEAKIYLFGSRLDMTKTGGDIDLFIISEQKSYEAKLEIKSKLKSLLHRPIDIIFHTDFDREIEQEGLRGKLL